MHRVQHQIAYQHPLDLHLPSPRATRRARARGKAGTEIRDSDGADALRDAIAPIEDEVRPEWNAAPLPYASHVHPPPASPTFAQLECNAWKRINGRGTVPTGDLQPDGHHRLCGGRRAEDLQRQPSCCDRRRRSAPPLCFARFCSEIAFSRGRFFGKRGVSLLAQYTGTHWYNTLVSGFCCSASDDATTASCASSRARVTVSTQQLMPHPDDGPHSWQLHGVHAHPLRRRRFRKRHPCRFGA